MNQRQKGLQEIIQTSIMIKSKKEHFEKQTQELLNFFAEDCKYQDPMLLMGVRYKDKEKEFYHMKKENEELKNKTRNLAEELNFLRNSIKDGEHLGHLRQSINPDFHSQMNLSSSKVINTTEDTEAWVKKQLSSIEQMKKQVRQESQQNKKQFKDRLELFFDQLEKQHKLQLLKNYGVSNKIQGNEEMVKIPKDLYDKLIEIYSVNVSESYIKEVQKKFYSQSNQIKLENIEVEKENLIKKYSNLLQNEKIGINNLHHLFEIIANKLSFQKQWERYHSENQKKSISFKYNIDRILNNSQVVQSQIENSPKKATKLDFVDKLDKIIQVVDFSQKQKQQWGQIKEKIQKHEFLNVQKIIKVARSQQESLKAEIKKMMAQLISLSLTESVKSFENFMVEKLQKKIKRDERFLKELSVDRIQQCLSKDLELANPQKWLDLSQKIISQKYQVIKQYQKKHFVFISTNQIYRSRLSIK